MSNISAAQLAANRANATHSTGPATEAGRAKSSLNALRTGLTGRTVLLPTDDIEEYERKQAVYHQGLEPATDEEARLVQNLVDASWRLDRIKRLETGILLKGQLEFAEKFNDQPESHRRLLIDTESYLKYEKQIRNLNIQEARLTRTMEKERAELNRLQAVRKRIEMMTAMRAQATSSNSTAPTDPRPENGFDFSTAATPFAAFSEDRLDSLSPALSEAKE